MSFDQCALQYDADLRQGLRLAGESPAWFACQRVEIARRHVTARNVTVRRLLEFGCGVGNHIPFFQNAFPGCEIIGLDISRQSLKLAAQHHPGQGIRFDHPDGFDEPGGVDLIYVNGVFHHIPHDQHADVLRRFDHWLRPGGVVILFDNNPFSLPARLVMKRIPFDRDAVMVNPYRLGRMLRDTGFLLQDRQFHFIFPRCLQVLRPIEQMLTPLPLGAQYCLMAGKPDAEKHDE